MKNEKNLIAELFAIRNKFGSKFAQRKISLLAQITLHANMGPVTIKWYYNTLLFILAYPDNEKVFKLAKNRLKEAGVFINNTALLKTGLRNTGLAGTKVHFHFTFEMAKWLRETYKDKVSLKSIGAGDYMLVYLISAAMPMVETEILRDANEWLNFAIERKENLLDALIHLLSQSDMQPEVRDALWAAMKLKIEIQLTNHPSLPRKLFKHYYHQNLLRKETFGIASHSKPVKVKISHADADKIIECARIALVQHVREIEPVSFCTADLISFYNLGRGISIALISMSPEQRHPVKSHFAYVVFKNGFPTAYAGTWLLFNAGRIGLNVFPEFRGGESGFLLAQIMYFHIYKFGLKRLIVDPYQIGKENDEALQSGAFWNYYRAGYRPVQNEQMQLAASENRKIENIQGYKSSIAILKKLALSPMELILSEKAVRFDTQDVSRLFLSIVKRKYNGDRNIAQNKTYNKLINILNLEKAHIDKNLAHVIRNWSVILMNKEKDIRNNRQLRQSITKLFKLKAHGREEAYLKELQKSDDLRGLLAACISRREQL